MDFANGLTNMTNEELFAEYKKTSNLEIKKEIVMRYIHIVKAIALQMRGIYRDFTQLDDMINEGVIALMGCVDKFEIDKNIKFETFVSKRIRGIIIDTVRKNDWVSRGVRKLAKDMDGISNELYNSLGRLPTDEEMAKALGISIDKYYEDVGKTALMNLVSFEMLLEETANGKLQNQIANKNNESMPEHHMDMLEVEEEIKAGLMTLREKEKLVISLYYIEELTMKEISKVLEVSEPRVSQLHSNALRKLNLFLKNRL